MKRIFLGSAAVLALGACVTAEGETISPEPMPPLAAQKDSPRLAMLEYMLGQYFASDIPNPPTVCASWNDGNGGDALPPEDEVALIARFPQLAPMTRCSHTENGWRDMETDEAALVFTLHNFTCASEESCAAWGGYRSNDNNSMSYHYRGDWSGAEWQFTRDPRIIAE